MIDIEENPVLQEAVRAACEIADNNNIIFDKPIILSHQSNVLIHLHPTSVVARVATTTGTVRKGDAWLKREVAVSTYLAENGAPIIPPSTQLPPGAYEHNGLILSFWEFVEVLKEPVDPFIAGRTLHHCHEVLSNFQGDLSILDPLEESERILPKLIKQGAFSNDDASMLISIYQRLNTKQIQAPMQPLHGDANFSNVLNTTRGVLWADWEDTFIGPVTWDLACLVARARVLGTEIEQANAALQGYGKDINEGLLDLFVEARTFQTVLWNYIIGQHAPQSLERLNARLQWFRERESFYL
ncbi:MAG: aminoglycoside phosphotransferase family protein [Calothrix sp. FI2-JRJ7]|jgi:thiamine kinase-like enzyme|nr:aminoglycoside phosphotransferase family protein [Calothrix sp. FI2-JRJ7]